MTHAEAAANIDEAAAAAAAAYHAERRAVQGYQPTLDYSEQSALDFDAAD